jgi:electron transfer flavoprotein alpha subunit
VLSGLISGRRPEAVLIGATARGHDLAPRLAARLGVGLLSDCIALDMDAGERVLLGTRETHGGLMLATMACPIARPQMATVRPGVLRAPIADRARQGSVEDVPVDISSGDIATEISAAAIPRPVWSLHDAPVVVVGGRGMDGAGGFAGLAELAAGLGGVVAASRSAVEQGWAAPGQMVDIAGASVQPDLLLAVAMSGAFPERMAMRGARLVVAINRDPAAPILSHCDYGIAGDWREIVPELLRAVREARAG